MVISIDVGREFIFESKEDVTDRGEKEKIIFHGLDDNLVSYRVGVAMVSYVNREVTLEMVGILQVSVSKNHSKVVGALDSILDDDSGKENQVEWEEIPMTPRKALTISHSLDIELEREASLSPKPKKRNVREPYMASLVETRSSSKPDVGIVTRRGRKSKKQAKEEETRRSLVDGCRKIFWNVL